MIDEDKKLKCDNDVSTEERYFTQGREYEKVLQYQHLTAFGEPVLWQMLNNETLKEAKDRINKKGSEDGDCLL